jgi:hypothetical protein
MKILLVIGAFCLAAPAMAEDTAPAAAKPVKEKKICRHEDVIGSVIPARICLTKAEWAEFDKHYQDTDQSFIERRKDNFNNMPLPHP